MQQVAASNKDLAAPGLFPGDTATSEIKESGVNFAKVMESHHSSSGDSSSNDQGYRGHGDFFDASGDGANRRVSLEEGAKKEAKIGDGFSDGFVSPDPESSKVANTEHSASQEPVLPADGKAQDLENNAHEEWISIIQKLKDGEGSTPGTVTPTLPEDGQGQGIRATPIVNSDAIQSDIELKNTDVLAQHLLQGEGSQAAMPSDTLPSEIFASSAEASPGDAEVISQELSSVELSGDDSVLVQTLSWKEELKLKLLNSGQPFNSQQMKAIEKDLSGMSDVEIQQLLDNDQALKQLLSDLMNVQEQELDPQDIALLMALTGEGQAQDDLQESQQDSLADMDALGNDGEITPAFSVDGNGSSSDSEEQQEESDESHDTLTATLTEQVSAESELEIDQQPELELQPELVSDRLQTPVSMGNESIGPVYDEIKGATNLETDAVIKQSTTIDSPVNPRVVNDSTATSDKGNLDKLLSELDSSVHSDKQKVANLESLTRRVESSELANTPAGKTFVETIKGATAEFKEQLKSGHEPGININKLVTEAVNAQTGNAEATALESQVRGAVQKMVDVAQTHLSLEPTTRENLVTSFQNSLSNRENNVAQVEAGKTQQQNFQNQIFDKAVNINKPEAAQELANKVQVMMNQKNMVADIRLDPPDLGQMQIKIALQGDSASVSMVVQSQAAREALEHNEPRLKELLEQQGIELGQSSVQQDSKGNKGESDGNNFASGKGSEAVDELAGDAEQGQVVTMNEPDGIDYFA